MTEIYQVEDLEEFFAQMRAKEAESLLHLTEEQKTIGWGCYAERTDTVERQGVRVMGKIYSRQESWDFEKELGADAEELASTDEALADAHERGYRYGMWYSQWEPDGEVGSAHVSRLTPRTREEFDEFISSIRGESHVDD